MTSDTAVILYGPPASGKDTVTDALSEPFVPYQRLKAGPGRTTGYRMATIEDLAAVDAAGDVIYRNARYGAVYVVDGPELDRLLAAGRVPVLHLGQPAAIDAVISARPDVRWITVELWCDRDTAAQRIAARETGDTAARLEAWDQTEHLASPDLQIDTATTSPAAAALLIRQAAL